MYKLVCDEEEDLGYLYFGISTEELNYCILNGIDPDDYYKEHYENENAT